MLDFGQKISELDSKKVRLGSEWVQERYSEIMNRQVFSIELYHHGVKGQKWGVRNGPPYPLDRSDGKEVAKSGEGDRIRITISGHKGPDKRGIPNSVVDHAREDGSVKARVFYDADGWKEKEIHTSDHGKPKWHPFGEYGEHIHVYEWDKERGIPNRSPRELTVEERKENEDIL
ncbi:MAG: hypothetical protein HFI81_06305 [Eubacterium sp.]|nr:hypothetical protein [Eubacterium sp.]